MPKFFIVSRVVSFPRYKVEAETLEKGAEGVAGRRGRCRCRAGGGGHDRHDPPTEGETSCFPLPSKRNNGWTVTTCPRSPRFPTSDDVPEDQSGCASDKTYPARTRTKES